MDYTRIQRPLFPVLVMLLLWLLLVVSGCSETFSTEVDSAQKISDTAGKFDGRLDNADQFGDAVASIGDLDGDEVGDIAVGANLDDGGGADKGGDLGSIHGVRKI